MCSFYLFVMTLSALGLCVSFPYWMPAAFEIWGCTQENHRKEMKTALILAGLLVLVLVFSLMAISAGCS